MSCAVMHSHVLSASACLQLPLFSFRSGQLLSLCLSAQAARSEQRLALHHSRSESQQHFSRGEKGGRALGHAAMEGKLRWTEKRAVGGAEEGKLGG
jgi:hypothetical protein